MVKNLDFSRKIDYVAQVKDILKFKEYQNSSYWFKVIVIFLNGWILSIGGVPLGREGSVINVATPSSLMLLEFEVYSFLETPGGGEAR